MNADAAIYMENMVKWQILNAQRSAQIIDLKFVETGKKIQFMKFLMVLYSHAICNLFLY